MPQKDQKSIYPMQQNCLGVFKTMSLADILRDGVKNAPYSKCKVLADWLEQNKNPQFAMQLLHFLSGYMDNTANQKRRQ